MAEGHPSTSAGGRVHSPGRRYLWSLARGLWTNAAAPRVARQWVRPRSSAMSIDVALSTRRGVGRDTYSLPQKNAATPQVARQWTCHHYIKDTYSLPQKRGCAPGAMSMDMALLSCAPSPKHLHFDTTSCKGRLQIVCVWGSPLKLRRKKAPRPVWGRGAWRYGMGAGLIQPLPLLLRGFLQLRLPRRQRPTCASGGCG